MSNHARLILLSGTGGAGTSTLAVATAEALRGEGLTVALIDASSGGEPDPVVVDRLASSVGRLGAELGADPLIPDAWSTLPGVRGLSALHRMSTALGDPGVDAVLVDAGSLAAARDLVGLPAAALRLLDALLTPRMAMHRTPGSTAEGTMFESLSALRLDILALRQMLLRPATTMRLVTTPDERSVRRTSRSLAVFALLGIGVDGVVVNRFPRKSEGWPKALRAEADRCLDLMWRLADGVEVWSSTSKVRPVPKGRSAMGPLGRVLVLDADQLTVTVGDEEFRMEIPLADPAREEARIGRQGDQLVVQFDDVTRWIDLPPVLRRCLSLEAVRTDRGLSVRFAPDPATWRQSEVAS